MISSPGWSAAIIFSCSFCFLRWGAIIRKYMAPNIRRNGSVPLNISNPDAEGAAWARIMGNLVIEYACVLKKKTAINLSHTPKRKPNPDRLTPQIEDQILFQLVGSPIRGTLRL